MLAGAGQAEGPLQAEEGLPAAVVEVDGPFPILGRLGMPLELPQRYCPAPGELRRKTRAVVWR